MKTIIGQNIKKIINERGFKQKAIAKKIGMSEECLSACINGRKIIRTEYVGAICEALEVSPNELLGYTKTEKGA